MSMSDILSSMGPGLCVWLFAWGINRIYLLFKRMVS